MMNENLKKALEAQARIRAERSDTLTIHGRVYDLRNEPNYRRAYLERLSRVGNSMMKAIRLKCFECSGFNSLESSACECRDCALWVLRENRKLRKAAGADIEEPEEDDLLG